MNLILSQKQYNRLTESDVRHHFRDRWARERHALKDYLINYGQIMISKENGKEYKCILDPFISNNLGMNYCICIQWDSTMNESGNIIYVRAYDKFQPSVY